MSERKPVVLLMNDIHISKDDIYGFKLNWNEALDVCAQRAIKNIFIGGDLFLSRSSQTLDVLMAVRDAVMAASERRIKLTIAEGNHDKVDQESAFGYSHLFSEYKDVFVVDDYSAVDIGDCATLYIMGYFPENGSFAERLETIVKDDFDHSRTNILYIHEGINGALATPSEKDLPAKIFKPFSKVLVGHYHDRCKIKGTNVEYIGASRQHNFGEDEEKGYTILYNDGAHEFVKNKVNVRYKTIDIQGFDVAGEFPERVSDLCSSGRYKVRVRVNCTQQEAASIDKSVLINAGASKVELVQQHDNVCDTDAQSLDKKFDKDGIKREYEGFCADKGINDVELGLSYLEKI